MKLETFQGNLGHKNPICPKCNSHCYALYRGGKKERVEDVFVCKNCSIIYNLSENSKCNLMEVDN